MKREIDSFEDLQKLFNKGDKVIALCDGKEYEVSKACCYDGDGYYYTKDKQSIKVYDCTTETTAEWAGHNETYDEKVDRCTKEFVRGFQNSPYDRPRDYLNSLYK